MKGYYFITDSALSLKGNVSDVKAALKAKVEVVQYRDKNALTGQMYQEALLLKRAAQGALFLINDRIDIALAVDADGVHLGAGDMPYAVARKMLGKKKVIGLTVRSLKEAQAAQKMGADYIGVAPIFATATKSDAGEPVGPRLIKKIKAKVSIPIVAIGGINLANAREVIQAGAEAICAISAVVGKPGARQQILKFQKLFMSLYRNPKAKKKICG